MVVQDPIERAGVQNDGAQLGASGRVSDWGPRQGPPILGLLCQQDGATYGCGAATGSLFGYQPLLGCLFPRSQAHSGALLTESSVCLGT